MKWVIGFVTGVLLASSSFYFYWKSQEGFDHIATHWIYSFYEKKTELANRVHEPKLLIASGSTSLFAFDSARISDEIQMPVINYGVAVGLGLKYILHKAKEQLSPGDVVLLPLEYKLYVDEHVPDKSLPLHLLDVPEYFSTLTFIEKMNIVLFTPTITFIDAFSPSQSSFHKDLYNVKSLNDYGDIDTDEMKRIYIEHNIHKYSFPGITPIAINERSTALITDFVTWAQQNDITVLAMPPAVNVSLALDSQSSEAVKHSLINFWSSLGVEFLGEHAMFEFAKEYMFENPYHLNDRGRALYMDALLGKSDFLKVMITHQKLYAQLH